MERDPLPPIPNRSTSELLEPPRTEERGGFLGKLRRKMTHSPEVLMRQTLANPEIVTQPEAVEPDRRKLGKEIIGLLFGEKTVPTVRERVARESETTSQLSVEQTPQFEHATRMRRFARVVLAHVSAEAEQEPAHSKHETDSSPLSTENLDEAAEDLRGAVDHLNITIARSSAAERIDERLRKLEVSAEDSRRASIAAVGLGVLAVIVTGAEYFSRKQNERETRSDAATTKRTVNKQGAEIARQRVIFDQLRESRAEDMAREQRASYYERLSTFTHEQADRTRLVDRELTRISQEVQDNQTSRPEVMPVVRVEVADTIEHAPGQRMGSAGTGFFGGGSIVSDGQGERQSPPFKPISANSPQAHKLEELRRAEQIRLQRNAWFYSLALAATLVGGVIAMIVIG